MWSKGEIESIVTGAEGESKDANGSKKFFKIRHLKDISVEAALVKADSDRIEPFNS